MLVSIRWGRESCRPIVLQKVPGKRLLLDRALADCGVGEPIGFGVILAGNMGDRESEGSSQFAAGPMQGVEARATAGVFAAHLANDNLGIGIDVKSLGFHGEGTLQGFEQGHIFRDIIILVADPFGDTDGAAFAAVDDHPNTRRTWIAQRTAIHIGHEI